MEFEKLGIPSVTVCTHVFATLGAHEAELLGTPDLPIVIVPHPIGSLSTVQVREVGSRVVDEIADYLLGRRTVDVAPVTTSRAESSTAREERLHVPRDDAALFDVFWERGWSEGLPVIAPTMERIERSLAYLGRDPADVLGVVAPRQGVATVEVVVANAIMAGCRDEDLPIVLAAVEGVCRPRHNIYGVQATTGSVTPMIVVFGPGARRLGIHGGVGCLSPGFRPNATIGRALRLVLWNVGGAHPGDLDRATHGQPGKFTLCIAENQDENPWPEWHTEHGFTEGETAVLVTGVMGTEDLIDYASQNVDDLLTMLSSCFHTMAGNHMLYGGWSTFLLCPEHAEMLAAAGMTRAEVARALVQRATLDYGAFPETSQVTLRRKRPGHFGPNGEAPASFPVFDSADHLQVVVAGGPGPHSVFLPSYGDLTDPQWVRVRWPGEDA